MYKRQVQLVGINFNLGEAVQQRFGFLQPVFRKAESSQPYGCLLYTSASTQFYMDIVELGEEQAKKHYIAQMDGIMDGSIK